MPKFLRRYLRNHDLKFHLIVALSLGLLVRALSAYFVYGPQALDDYKHGILPAYQLFAGLPVELPLYRSYLIVWLLAGFMKVASVFGVTTALTQVRSMYFGLGVLSEISILGGYFYARCFRSRIFGALSLYLLAVYPLMPFVSTRAFGEAVAMSFVVLGLGLAEYARRKSRRSKEIFLGLVFIGIAALFRFQVGLIFCFYSLLLLYLRERRFFYFAVLAGFSVLIAQGLIDVGSGKAPFQTLQVYLAENEGGAAKYGSSPWFNTWLVVLGLTLFPFSLVFTKKLKYLVARHGPMLSSLLIFVFTHSLVPHKEERFMYPIFGLVLILLAYVWTLNRHDRRTQRYFTPVFAGFCIIALPLACFVNSQAGEVEPAARAEKQIGPAAYLDHQSLFSQSLIQPYFLRTTSRLFQVGADGLTLATAENIMHNHPELRGSVFLTSDPDAFVRIRDLAGQSSQDLICGSAAAATSVIDRLLYRLNPKHNQRRRPTLYIICERKV